MNLIKKLFDWRVASISTLGINFLHWVTEAIEYYPDTVGYSDAVRSRIIAPLHNRPVVVCWCKSHAETQRHTATIDRLRIMEKEIFNLGVSRVTNDYYCKFRSSHFANISLRSAVANIEWQGGAVVVFDKYYKSSNSVVPLYV